MVNSEPTGVPTHTHTHAHTHTHIHTWHNRYPAPLFVYVYIFIYICLCCYGWCCSIFNILYVSMLFYVLVFLLSYFMTFCTAILFTSFPQTKGGERGGGAPRRWALHCNSPGLAAQRCVECLISNEGGIPPTTPIRWQPNYKSQKLLMGSCKINEHLVCVCLNIAPFKVEEWIPTNKRKITLNAYSILNVSTTTNNKTHVIVSCSYGCLSPRHGIKYLKCERPHQILCYIPAPCAKSAHVCTHFGKCKSSPNLAFWWPTGRHLDLHCNKYKLFARLGMLKKIPGTDVLLMNYHFLIKQM